MKKEEQGDGPEWSVAPSRSGYFDDDGVSANRRNEDIDIGKPGGKLFRIVNRLMAAQREYLIVLRALDHFFRKTIIEDQISKFKEALKKKPGLIEMVDAHAKLTSKIVEDCCLDEKGVKVLLIFYNLMSIMVKYGQLCREIEDSVLLEDYNLEDKIDEVYHKVRSDLMVFRKELSGFLRLLYKYDKAGVDMNSKIL